MDDDFQEIHPHSNGGDQRGQEDLSAVPFAVMFDLGA